MSINIKDYETKLQGYTAQINNGKQEIANAERELLVSQTQLNTYQEQMNALEVECKNLTGKSITDIDKVISTSMAQLEKVMNKVNQVSTITPNVNSMSEEDLMATMQLGTEE